MRNAHGHNFNGTQYSITNKLKQHSRCYHFLLCATSGNANVAQQGIIEHFKRREYSIFKFFLLIGLQETLKHGHSHMQYTAALEAFLEEKQSLKIHSYLQRLTRKYINKLYGYFALV